MVSSQGRNIDRYQYVRAAFIHDRVSQAMGVPDRPYALVIERVPDMKYDMNIRRTPLHVTSFVLVYCTEYNSNGEQATAKGSEWAGLFVSLLVFFHFCFARIRNLVQRSPFSLVHTDSSLK